MRRQTIWISLAMASLMVGAVVFLEQETRLANSDAAATQATGETLYARYCASCHGANLEGEPNWRERKPNGRLPAPPHDASGHTWHHPDAVLFKITKLGTAAVAPPGYESDMPGFADTLSDAEIRDVLAYIRSRWPPEIRARQAAISAASDG